MVEEGDNSAGCHKGRRKHKGHRASTKGIEIFLCLKNWRMGQTEQMWKNIKRKQRKWRIIDKQKKSNGMDFFDLCFSKKHCILDYKKHLLMQSFPWHCTWCIKTGCSEVCLLGEAPSAAIMPAMEPGVDVLWGCTLYIVQCTQWFEEIADMTSNRTRLWNCMSAKYTLWMSITFTLQFFDRTNLCIASLCKWQ